MRSLPFPVILVSLGAILAASISTQGADRNPVRALLDDQVSAWNRGDIDGFMQAYARSPNTTFVSGDEVTRGWQTVRDRYKNKYSDREKMGTLAFSDLEITLLSVDAAVVLGRWELKGVNEPPSRRSGVPGEPHGRFTLILRKFTEGWRIVHDHTSAAKQL